MILEIVLKIFGGLGLFLIGIYLFTNHVKKFSGIYIRKYVNRFTKTNLSSFILGIVAGAVSTSAFFIGMTSAGLVLSGAISITTAQFISAGSSIGTISLIIGATLDINKLVLLILGVSGFLLQFVSTPSSRLHTISNVMVGFGLLFLGIDLMKQGAAPIKDIHVFSEFVSSTHEYVIPALLISFIISLVSQSEVTSAVFGFTLMNAGLLNLDQSIMYVYGTCIGVGVATLLLSLGFKGRVRRGGVFNAVLKMIGAVILVPLLYLEIHTSFPLVKNILILLPFSLEHRIAALFLFYKVISVLIWYIFNGTITALIGTYFPITQEEDYSTLKYISGLNSNDVYGSMDLIQKEQARLFERTPLYLDSIREDVPAESKVDFKTLHDANNNIQEEIEYYVADLFSKDMSKDQTRVLLYIHNLQEIINSLNNNLYRFVEVLNSIDQREHVKSFCDIFIEGTHASLLTAVDAINSKDNLDNQILMKITSDKGDVVENIKRDYLIEALNIPAQNQNRMLELLVFYERIAWLLNRIAVITDSYINSGSDNKNN